MRRGITKKQEAIQSLLDSRRDEIESWCRNGETLELMGSRLGVNYGTVRNYCIRSEIEYTTKRGWRPGTHTGESHHSWKGGRRTCGVYVRVRSPNHPYSSKDGTVAEHRLVMEGILGRHLKKTEVVHHKDGNPQNNDPSNLELFDSNGEHISAEHSGWKMTDESRNRLSDAKKGRSTCERTAESNARLSAALKGRKFSDEHRQHISESAKNRAPITDKQRAEISERLKRAHQNNPEWAMKSASAMKVGRQQWILRLKAQKEIAIPKESGTDDLSPQ